MLVKEEVEGFFVFVEDKDSPSAGISGLRVMRIVDVANITNPGGEKGSPAILKVVAGEVSEIHTRVLSAPLTLNV